MSESHWLWLESNNASHCDSTMPSVMYYVKYWDTVFPSTEEKPSTFTCEDLSQISCCYVLLLFSPIKLLPNRQKLQMWNAEKKKKNVFTLESFLSPVSTSMSSPHLGDFNRRVAVDEAAAQVHFWAGEPGLSIIHLHGLPIDSWARDTQAASGFPRRQKKTDKAQDCGWAAKVSWAVKGDRFQRRESWELRSKLWD